MLGFSGAKGDHVQIDPGTSYAVAQEAANTVIHLGANGDEMILQDVQLSSLRDGWLFIG